MGQETLGQVAYEAWQTNVLGGTFDWVKHPFKSSWEAAAQAVIAEVEQRRWKPIETAPVGDLHPYDGRDGRATFLLYWNGFHRGVGFAQRNDDSGEVEYLNETGDYIEPKPTHWAELPAGPEAANEPA